MVYEGYWSVRTSTQLKQAGQKTSKGSIVKRDYTVIPDGHLYARLAEVHLTAYRVHRPF